MSDDALSIILKSAYVGGPRGYDLSRAIEDFNAAAKDDPTLPKVAAQRAKDLERVSNRCYLSRIEAQAIRAMIQQA